MRKSASVFTVGSTDNARINSSATRFKGKFGCGITSNGIVDFMSHNRRSGVPKDEIFEGLRAAYEIPNDTILEVLWERSRNY